MGAAEGWRGLSPGWPSAPLRSAGATRTGSVPSRRCPWNRLGPFASVSLPPARSLRVGVLATGAIAARDAGPPGPLPGPWQCPSPSARPPLPWAGGLRARAPPDEELQRPVRGAEGPAPAHHHLRLEEPHRARRQRCPPCPPMPLRPTASARLGSAKLRSPSARYGSATLGSARQSSARLRHFFR